MLATAAAHDEVTYAPHRMVLTGGCVCVYVDGGGGGSPVAEPMV